MDRRMITLGVGLALAVSYGRVHSECTGYRLAAPHGPEGHWK